MSSRLHNRIQKLERSAVPTILPEQRKINEQAREYYEFIYSMPFVDEFCEKVATLFETMTDEYIQVVLSDCRAHYEWDSKSGELLPAISRITEYFFALLRASLESQYAGPLALPAAVADYSRGVIVC